ncbi:Uncharacterised protein [Shigella sonnei]|nr:Uncharacterised protein [Shigella sonnei]CSQ62001.1 Uncharacterised protein [Shigella sonnei]CSQ70545.1 Uncharacterised protein [Shigella sonnei]CSQ79767.1 Uncharacterised protein [Shigella sonnei]CSQ82447.1 Uncharacterised protein [Shigella sonnei]
MVTVTDFRTGIPGVRAVVSGAKAGESCGILVVMVNVLTDEVDICSGLKHGRGIETGTHRLRFTTEGITACMAVGIGHGHPGEEVKAIEFMFVIRTDLNVGVVVTESTAGRPGSAHDSGPCTGLTVNVTQITHTFVKVVDLSKEGFIAA